MFDGSEAKIDNLVAVGDADAEVDQHSNSYCVSGQVVSGGR